MRPCHKYLIRCLIWFVTSTISIVCISCHKEKPYSLSIQDNHLYITMPHPTIGIVGINEVSWRGVDLDELTNDIYTTLENQNLPNIYSVYVKFETSSTDKYGNKEKSYKEAFLFEVSVEEVRKYKDSKYFGNSYDLTGKLHEAAFANNITFDGQGQLVEPRVNSNTSTNTQEKDYDLFINMMRNPQLSLYNFVAGGMNYNNTQLLDRYSYESSPKVRAVFSKANGCFDKERFDAFYDKSRIWFENLESVDYEEAVKNTVKYHRDDIFAPHR